MMPDLGKYQDAVLSAYGASLFLMLGLVAIMIWRARVVKRQLEETEKRGT